MKPSGRLAEVSLGRQPASRGQDTARRIVEAAYQLLGAGSGENFSMRNVAGRAGISLGNLQYYFPLRKYLISAVLSHVDALYQSRYAAVLASAENSPAGRFEAAIRFNVKDVRATGTRHFFVQLWPLLNAEDEDHDGKMFTDLYAPQIGHLQQRVQELAPDIATGEAQVRGTVIAAMIEGLTVTMPGGLDSAQQPFALIDHVVAAAFAIALSSHRPVRPPSR